MKWWSVPICGECWAAFKPDREPVRLLTEDEAEPCVCCFERPHVGIYVRASAETMRELRQKLESTRRDIDNESHD